VTPPAQEPPLPIVDIGASAGGLEAVEQFLRQVPENSGLAYGIPPDKDMSILHGLLHLLAPTAPRGLRLPIDFFLRSLAADR
jgi:two-component system CheB/CheR fusion protein